MKTLIYELGSSEQTFMTRSCLVKNNLMEERNDCRTYGSTEHDSSSNLPRRVLFQLKRN